MSIIISLILASKLIAFEAYGGTEILVHVSRRYCSIAAHNNSLDF